MSGRYVYAIANEKPQVRRKSPDRKPAAKTNAKASMPKRIRTSAKAVKG